LGASWAVATLEFPDFLACRAYPDSVNLGFRATPGFRAYQVFRANWVSRAFLGLLGSLAVQATLGFRASRVSPGAREFLGSPALEQSRNWL
jgi:hypothetical protein